MTTEDEFIPTYLQASDVKGMPNAEFQLLLAEFPFYLYEHTLLNFLWFMQDGALIRKILQHMTLHDGRWLMEQLNATWYGKNPAHASPAELRAGTAAVKKIESTLRRLQDEGKINYQTM